MNLRIVFAPALFVAIASFGGCQNACQELCVELLDYAADCGYEVTAQDLTNCKNEQRNVSEVDLQICIDGLEKVEQPATGEEVARVRITWTCEDIQTNVLSGGGDDSAAQ